MHLNFHPVHVKQKPEVLAMFKRAAEKIHKKGVDHWQYWHNPPQSEKAKYVHSLVVEDAYHGQGLGAKILEAVAAQAKAQGCRYLRLDADFRNPRLCAYYVALGFDHVGLKELTISSYNLYRREL